MTEAQFRAKLNQRGYLVCPPIEYGYSSGEPGPLWIEVHAVRLNDTQVVKHGTSTGRFEALLRHFPASPLLKIKSG